MSRAALETSARRAVTRAAVVGLGAPRRRRPRPRVAGRGIAGGFAGLFVVMIGCAFVAPSAALLLLRLLHPIAAGPSGSLGRLATRGIVAALSRTRVAIAALMIAVSAAIGVGIMIASFREAVVRWLEGTLRADVYVSAPSLVGSRPDATLDPALVARPGAHARRGRDEHLARRDRVGTARAGAGGRARRRSRAPPALALSRGRRRTASGSAGGEAVIVSEPYANRHGARAGGVVRLRTDRGERDFRVAGVFYDYGSSAGVVVMSRAHLRALLGRSPRLEPRARSRPRGRRGPR